MPWHFYFSRIWTSAWFSGLDSTVSQDTIYVGFLRIGIRVGFSLDQDSIGFLRIGMLWFFGWIRILFSVGLDVSFSSLDFRLFKGSGCFCFSGFGLFRLLIQRCKNVTGDGSLFDKGVDWHDESKFCPTKGIEGERASLARGRSG